MRTAFLQVGAVLTILGAVALILGYGATRGWFALPLSHDRKIYSQVMRRMFPTMFRWRDDDFQTAERGYQSLD